MKSKIINLISGPRNISTALMYSFAQRKDTFAMDEPFYAVYLSRSGAMHPGREDVLRSLSSDENTVKKDIEDHSSHPVLFVKNMAHHMEVLHNPWLPNSVNVLLIRDPRQIIASYSEVIQKPVMRDIGIEYQYRLFNYLCERNEQPIVLDSGQLLLDPEKVLTELCHLCAIGFDPAMMKWNPGPKAYDGVWATHWYGNVHQSQGFQKQITSNRPLPDSLNSLYVQANGYYEKLAAFSLKA